jgi:hypothetical protein
MKAFSLARQSIFGSFDTARASSADYSTEALFPIEGRNRRGKRPTSGPWGRITLGFGTRNAVSIGGASGANNRKRTPFVLTLQIFVPEHEGEAAAFLIAEQIMGPLDLLASNLTDIPSTTRLSVNFQTASFEPVGKVGGEDEGASGTEQFNSSISGHFDDLLV